MTGPAARGAQDRSIPQAPEYSPALPCLVWVTGSASLAASALEPLHRLAFFLRGKGCVTRRAGTGTAAEHEPGPGSTVQPAVVRRHATATPTRVALALRSPGHDGIDGGSACRPRTLLDCRSLCSVQCSCCCVRSFQLSGSSPLPTPWFLALGMKYEPILVLPCEEGSATRGRLV